MILKDIHSECQRCANLKAWNIHMNGEHDYACRLRPMFISKDLHREGCEKFIDEDSDDMNIQKFNIGDKVIEEQASGFGSRGIGVIISISKKRGDITVDFGNYTRKYNSDGWQKGRSYDHNPCYIRLADI